jgi:hypothetical protein
MLELHQIQLERPNIFMILRLSSHKINLFANLFESFSDHLLKFVIFLKMH